MGLQEAAQPSPPAPLTVSTSTLDFFRYRDILKQMYTIDWNLVLDGNTYELNAKAYRTTVPSLRARAHYHAEKRGLRVLSERVKGHSILRLRAIPGSDDGNEPALVRVEVPVPGVVPVSKGTVPMSPVPIAVPPERFSSDAIAEFNATSFKMHQRGTWDAFQRAASTTENSALAQAYFEAARDGTPDPDPADFPDPVPVVYVNEQGEEFDPDDYSDECDCGQYPKCLATCFNYLDEQGRAAYYAMSPAEHDARRAAAAPSQPPAPSSNEPVPSSNEPVPDSLSAPADYDSWKAAAIARRAQLDPSSNGHKPVPSSLPAPASDIPDPDPGT